MSHDVGLAMTAQEMRQQFEEDNRKFLESFPRALENCPCDRETKDRTTAIAMYVFGKLQELQKQVLALAVLAEQSVTGSEAENK